jgi:hypothetical protein
LDVLCSIDSVIIIRRLQGSQQTVGLSAAPLLLRSLARLLVPVDQGNGQRIAAGRGG